jgi:hypothetical protein
MKEPREVIPREVCEKFDIVVLLTGRVTREEAEAADAKGDSSYLDELCAMCAWDPTIEIETAAHVRQALAEYFPGVNVVFARIPSDDAHEQIATIRAALYKT